MVRNWGIIRMVNFTFICHTRGCLFFARGKRTIKIMIICQNVMSSNALKFHEIWNAIRNVFLKAIWNVISLVSHCHFKWHLRCHYDCFLKCLIKCYFKCFLKCHFKCYLKCHLKCHFKCHFKFLIEVIWNVTWNTIWNVIWNIFLWISFEVPL